MNRSERGRLFEREFFGKSLCWEYHRGIPVGSMTFEEALSEVIILHRRGYRHYRKGGIRDSVHAEIVKLIQRHLDIYCAVNTVLDRDYGIDGLFCVKIHGRIRVITFDLVLHGHKFNMATQKAHLRIEPIDISPRRIEGLAVAVMRLINSDAAYDATEIFRSLSGATIPAQTC